MRQADDRYSIHFVTSKMSPFFLISCFNNKKFDPSRNGQGIFFLGHVMFFFQTTQKQVSCFFEDSLKISFLYKVLEHLIYLFCFDITPFWKFFFSRNYHLISPNKSFLALSIYLTTLFGDPALKLGAKKP